MISIIILFGIFTCLSAFPFGNFNQDFIWDVNRCSNINPIVDRKTIFLTAKGKWPDDKFCTAIRRDLKVSDDTAYTMSTEFVQVSGRYGYVGFMFNVWDDYNYDWVYKR